MDAGSALRGRGRQRPASDSPLGCRAATLVALRQRHDLLVQCGLSFGVRSRSHDSRSAHRSQAESCRRCDYFSPNQFALLLTPVSIAAAPASWLAFARALGNSPANELHTRGCVIPDREVEPGGGDGAVHATARDRCRTGAAQPCMVRLALVAHVGGEPTCGRLLHRCACAASGSEHDGRVPHGFPRFGVRWFRYDGHRDGKRRGIDRAY